MKGEKMKKMIDIADNVKEYLSDKNNRRKILKISLKALTVFFVIACVITLFIWLVLLIRNNWETIVVVIGSIGSISLLILGFFPKKKPNSEMQPTPTSYLQYDPITLENTYKLLRNGLCIILGEISDIIKVRKPASFSQMDSPTHYDIISNVPIYHYLVPKQGGEVDTYTTMGILQNAIEQKLNNNEFSGISQSVLFYNGQAYPALMVDNVHDYGTFIQIDLAVASEFYCRYREQRLYQIMNQSNVINPQDMDF